MNLKLIREKVFQVYKECDIHSFPIDCFSILDHYALKTVTYQDTKENNPELYKAISSYSNDAFRFRMTVYYNALSNSKRIRFSLMHELGHLLLGHNESSEDTEYEADLFASNILAPRPIIHFKHFKTAEQLRDYFDISISAANIAIYDYHCWSYRGLSIDEVEFLDFFYPNYYKYRDGNIVSMRIGDLNYIVPEKSIF